MKIEVIRRDPDLYRANRIPMKHPREAKLDINPPEEWYMTVRLPVRIDGTLVHCTLPQLAERESDRMTETLYDAVTRPSYAPGREKMIERRRRRVSILLTTEWATSAEIGALAGLETPNARDDLVSLRERGVAEMSRVKMNRRIMAVWRRGEAWEQYQEGGNAPD